MLNDRLSLQIARTLKLPAVVAYAKLRRLTTEARPTLETEDLEPKITISSRACLEVALAVKKAAIWEQTIAAHWITDESRRLLEQLVAHYRDRIEQGRSRETPRTEEEQELTELLEEVITYMASFVPPF